MLLTRFMKAYGSVYIRIVANSIVVMLIGLSLLYIGYDYLNGRLVVIPPSRFFRSVEEYSTPRYVAYFTSTISLRGETEISRVSLAKSGLITVRVESYSTPSTPSDVIEAYYVKKNFLNDVLKVLQPDRGDEYVLIAKEAILSSNQEFVIPAKDPGAYVIVLKTGVSGRVANLRYHVTVVEFSEGLDVVLAKWLQLGGFTMLILGVLTFLLAPITSSFYIHLVSKTRSIRSRR